MLYEKITAAVKEAMLAKDSLKRDCLRYALSDIKNLTVNAGKPIDDEVCLRVLKKLVKQHEDSITQFTENGRQDLAGKEKMELQALQSFLPEMLNREQTMALVEQTIEDCGIARTKKSMGILMKQLKAMDNVDMKTASQCLNEILVG